MTNRSPLYLLTTIAVLLSSLASFTSCNKDKDNDDSYSYSSSTQTTLVTGFALQADAKVLSNLDSVHFTVDFDRGLIYNADSLPKGTDISALKVTVDFLNTVSSAVFKITDATKQADTTINYTTSMTKSLDFTGKTLLTVTSSDKSQVKDYEVKVLVHKVNPDSLVIPQSWRRDLPGYQSGLKGYKAVKMGDQYCIMAYDGTTCELMIADSPNQGTWSSQLVDLPFVPQVESLVATTGSFYMLDDDGVLYASENGIEWTSCGVVWHSLLGAYEDRVLGVLGDDDGYYHDEYPRPADFTATEVEEGFPIAHASDMAREPRLLVLDEPTSGLDARERKTVMGAVDEVRRGGCAVVMVCHDMEVVSDFATRLVVMAEGRVLADGAAGEVFSRSDLLARARVAAPQVADVAGRLARSGVEAFSGVSDARELARVVEGMVC